MKKYLFICCTPLQGVIAKRIIETEKLDKRKCVLFFYTSFDNNRYRKSFNDLSKLCSDSLYYVWEPNFPKYIFEAKKFFNSYKYSRLYFASIDSIFVQLAVSQTKNIEIYTFDDGSANIVPSSLYYRKQKLSFKRLVFKILGNRYSSQKIKKIIKQHYTIYPNLQNISSNTVNIKLFNENTHNSYKVNAKLSATNCVVILGTVYEEVFKDSTDIDSIKDFITRLASQKNSPVYYISHPREKDWARHGLKEIQSDLIAEEVILSLLYKFNKIEVYSIGSTVQLNLASVEQIDNIFIKVENEKNSIKELRFLESQITGQPYKLIEV
ncbi:glycosyltransferase family 52 [Psychrobacter faecalis]